MKKLPNSHKLTVEVVGLDVHKSFIAYSLLDRRGQERESGRIRSSRASLSRLFDEKIGRRRTHIAFEASRSSLWVYRLGAERLGKDRVHVAQASRIRAIANSQEKNDANDAWWLAYLTHEGRLPESYVPPDEILELRIATRERHNAVKVRTKIINRLKGHLAQLGEVVPSSSIKTRKAREYLRTIAQTVSGIRGHAINVCLDALRRQEDIIEEWNQTVLSLTKNLPDVHALQKEIPGVGHILAATIIAETGPVRRFTCAKAFAKYTGLTPSDRSSGGRTIHGHISREGSPYLRWAAVSCCRSRSGPGGAIGEWIRTKQKRLGAAKARSAAARKIAESIWRLFKHGEGFDAARAFRVSMRAA